MATSLTLHSNFTNNHMEQGRLFVFWLKKILNRYLITSIKNELRPTARRGQSVVNFPSSSGTESYFMCVMFALDSYFVGFQS